MSESKRLLNAYSAILIPLRFSRELDGVIVLLVFGAALLLLNSVADRFYAELALLMLFIVAGCLCRCWTRRPPPKQFRISAAFEFAFFNGKCWYAFSPVTGTYLFRQFGIVRWRDERGRIQGAWFLADHQRPEAWRRSQVIWRWSDRTTTVGIG